MKLYCIFSKQSLSKMNGIRGKMASQAGHAFLHSFWDAEIRFPEDAAAYKNGKHAKKITLVVDTDEEALEIFDKLKLLCGATKVVDAGFTVFDEPTFTCIGLGPVDDDGKVATELSKYKTLT